MRMSKQENKGLVPVLRFPEFRDKGEWEVKRLGSIGSFVRGLTYSAADVSERGLLVLRSSNIQEGSLVLDKDLVFVSKSCSNELALHRGDIVICMSNGSKALVGKNAEYVGNYPNPITIGAFCSFFRPRSQFAKYIFQTDRYLSFVSFSIGGGNINNLKNSDLEEFTATVPKDVGEQQKITDCLASIDELITAQTQKLDSLMAHKKGLMQQLFPADGETVPKLRFPEFRDKGKWQLKRINEVLVEQARPIDMQDDQDYSLVTVKRRYGGVVSRGIFKGKSIKVKSQFLLHENDFLISKRQIVHCACGVVPKELKGSIVSNEYSVLTPRKNNDIHFFNYFSQQPAVSESFLQCSIGIVIEKMLFKLNGWLKQEFFFPEHDEQKKIAQFLSNLDDLIESQTKKLEALKAHKKGLMQQLFPAMDEVDA
jgi:type I restriction enzyme S subunit